VNDFEKRAGQSLERRSGGRSGDWRVVDESGTIVIVK
jgi:ribosomal silencing factor RsfS